MHVYESFVKFLACILFIYLSINSLVLPVSVNSLEKTKKCQFLFATALSRSCSPATAAGERAGCRRSCAVKTADCQIQGRQFLRPRTSKYAVLEEARPCK